MTTGIIIFAMVFGILSWCLTVGGGRRDED